MTVFLYPNQTKDTDLSVTRSAAELLRRPVVGSDGTRMLKNLAM